MSKFVNPCKVITGPLTRWSYANVWDPKSINGGTPKFSICLLIPKTDIPTLDKVNRAMAAAFEEGQSKLKNPDGSMPDFSTLKLPLRDGDAEHPGDPTYAGNYFINAFSNHAPGIVDANRQPILQRSEVYSGVYGRASITMYAYNNDGNRGIACALNNLQKLRDGDPLGSHSRPEDDFDIEDEEDDDIFIY